MSDELIDVFVAESRELVEQAASALETLSEGAADSDALDRLFRAFHTLKGSAALMAFGPMTDLFHAGEDRLGEIRVGDGRVSPQLAEALFAILDRTEAWLDQTAAAGKAPEDAAADDLVRQLMGAIGSTAQSWRDPGPRRRERAASRTLRIESRRVDDLAAAADELVVLKNRLSQLTLAASGELAPGLKRALANAQAQLDQQVLRLHAAAMRLRMASLAPVFRPLPRLVRETASKLGKQVTLQLTGRDVEVDKTVVDGLYEPLLHLVRNALDHGIETPAERRAAGKPETAQVTVTATTVGDQAVIEVTDDGRGVDPAVVRQTALARGLVAPAALAGMSDEAAAQLIFAPGFSTASEVGELSGRGVGLDAVQAAVAALGGRVSVSSIARQGARFVIALPLNVRLAGLMTVRAGAETFGLLLESVVEATRITPRSLTPVRAGRAFVWRDQPVPLLELSALIRAPSSPSRDEINVVIIRTGDDIVGVAVDDFGDRLEAPLRPMTGLLAGAAGIAGATLAGDGRVLMVLDLAELIG
jgi:two-component system chemotaxis sensor kinase CheA